MLISRPDYSPILASMSVMAVAVAFQIGTGGIASVDYYKQRGPKGYPYLEIGNYGSLLTHENSENIRTPAENLIQIRAVLKPTITDLAMTLDVSRQAIYDWQNGKPITSENASRIADLARAADIFAAHGLGASAQLLRRPIKSKKTLLEIVHDGGSAEEAAQTLVHRIQSELKQRRVLAERLSGRPRPEIPTEDYGAPIMDELG